jgi:hypothetical protein
MLTGTKDSSRFDWGKTDADSRGDEPQAYRLGCDIAARSGLNYRRGRPALSMNAISFLFDRRLLQALESIPLGSASGTAEIEVA